MVPKEYEGNAGCLWKQCSGQRGACIEEIEQIDKALATGGPAIIVAAGLPHTSIGVLQHEKFGE